jgi:hypothetical protein
MRNRKLGSLKFHGRPRRNHWAMNETAQLRAQLTELAADNHEREDLQRKIHEVSSWLTQDEIMHFLGAKGTEDEAVVSGG